VNQERHVLLAFVRAICRRSWKGIRDGDERASKRIKADGAPARE
jgi:hypothetical protein